MSQIKQYMVDATLDFLDRLAVKAVVTVEGVETEQPIYLARIEKNTVRKYVRLTEERGLITKAVLVDSEGRPLVEKVLNYQKGNKPYIIAFPITQKIIVGEE